MTTMTFEQHEANIKALEKAANAAWGPYDRASRSIAANEDECAVLWSNWRRAQDAWEAALRAKEDRRKAFEKLLRG